MLKFQENLYSLRKKTGLSQKQMAEKLGLSYRSYRRYESGETEPTLSALLCIADYFGVTLDYLVGRTDEPSPGEMWLAEGQSTLRG